MGKTKSFLGREAFHRINFLYQACHALRPSSSDTPAHLVLSAYYGQIITGVAKKSQLRIDPSIKRTLCKGCGALLVAGKTVTESIKKQNGGQLKKICLQCRTVKTFNLKQGHQLWTENPESVVQTLFCEKANSPSVVSPIISSSGDTPASNDVLTS